MLSVYGTREVPIPESVTRTGGGAFDRGEAPVFFIAANSERLRWGSLAHDHLLIAINELEGETHETRLDDMMTKGGKMLIDSGVFALAIAHARKHGVSHNEGLSMAPDQIDGFDELYDRYCTIVRTYGERSWGYIEIDQGGKDNKRKTRAKLEAEGFRPIPVYHPLNDGWDYFDELATNYDRICLGNVVQADLYTRRRLLGTIHERLQRYPYLWVHALGLTPSSMSLGYPVHSCDSSAWLTSVRFARFHEKACTVPFSRLSSGYQYDREQEAGNGTAGSRRAAMLSAYLVRMIEHNWQGYRDMMEALDGAR